MAAGGAALWRRLSAWLPRGRLGLAALLGRLSDRLSRGRDRRARRNNFSPAESEAGHERSVDYDQSNGCVMEVIQKWLILEGAHRFQWIRNLVPEFGISSSHVKVLSSPGEFYELLKVQIKAAKQRVVMASLYLGTGILEQELVSVEGFGKGRKGLQERDVEGLGQVLMLGCKFPGRLVEAARVADAKAELTLFGMRRKDSHQDMRAVLARPPDAEHFSWKDLFAFVMRRQLSLQVDCLEETLEKSLQAKSSPDFRVSILLDYTRGSRGRKNSRTMLIPLLQRFPEKIRVSLFHTPNLRGLLRLLIPERFNETIGLQHIKLYLFDDNVILSGANLSDLYFTNRQDRYVLLQDSPEIADFFTELVDAIGDVSLQLQQDDTVQMMEGMVHPYQGDKVAYCEIANRRVMEVINSARTRQELLHAKTFHSSHPGSSLLSQQGSQASGSLKPEPDTWIYPLIQMKPFGIQIDEMVTETLLTEAERDARIYLTTGYFNLTQAYMDLILGTRAEYRILLASPEVNGFFGAKGVAGAIPAAYVYIEHQFYSEVCYLQQQERVQLQEYSRAGWTFHAKGLWLYLAGSDLPCLTLIGSPNFGYRSVHRDLEAQVAIVTENKALQQQLHQEQEQLYLCSGVVSTSTFEQPNRYVKLWVKLVTPLIKNFF
ncbi:putative CDP-diacylglycerol--glycerol-3-phosphate 3-phosphatidyltransferase [Willisornis vidua]|uniref:CDP-diacylglycerol--glycerol-3-phosphate 3-phosphatidyltransferase n=1 Tax=Willisornis vidua TaxID=1566151 RepID=A0ABQ9DSU6_9PASS|nr:putative CDP-diacylglycerol--glycerol-3-phosphate 3-phosphatidyltransferase [Willisornis vidua]